MKFEFLSPASKELEEAARFYEEKSTGLGDEFLTEVRAAIKRITNNPQAWTPLNDRIRRCRMNHFPYALIYTIEEEYILIVSVMNLRKHPESWQKNLGNT